MVGQFHSFLSEFEARLSSSDYDSGYGLVTAQDYKKMPIIISKNSYRLNCTIIHAFG